MSSSKEKIIEVLERGVAEARFSRTCFAESFLKPLSPNQGYTMPYCRITHVLDGTLQLNVGSGKTFGYREFPRGTTLVMKPFAVTGGVWTKRHETLALVCHPEHLRIIHAVHDRIGVPLLEPTWYYHLKDSLRICTTEAISCLCNLSEGEESDRLAPQLLQVAFELILADVRRSQTKDYGKANALWQRILEYSENFPLGELNRRILARHFNVTETYVSRLFRRFSGQTFKEHQRSECLKVAVRLLDETNLSVKEIAWRSGFQSESYFIRCFRSVYNVSPGFHRQLRK